jgi:hypothetical protein
MNKSYRFFGCVIPKPGSGTLPRGVRHKNALQSQEKLQLFWSQTGNFDLFRHCDLVVIRVTLRSNGLREQRPVTISLKLIRHHAHRFSRLRGGLRTFSGGLGILPPSGISRSA